MSITPLFGHTSPETAYVVEDYPYGFRLRTTIRYWIERSKSHGWRFMSQTINPKTGSWNKPKGSVYVEFGAGMYLDEQGHVQWRPVSVWAQPSSIFEFISTFGHGIDQDMRDHMKLVLRKNIAYKNALIDGKIVWTINNQPRPETPADLARHAEELNMFKASLDLLVVTPEDEAIIADLRAEGLADEAENLLNTLRREG